MIARTLRALAGAVLVALLPAGCGLPDLAGLPLPGGAPKGDGYAVTAEFSDVLDLVPQSSVKVNDVSVTVVCCKHELILLVLNTVCASQGI